jgi:hypothetical protein
MLGNIAGNRDPAPVVTVSAVTLVARAVEILTAEPLGDDPVLSLPLLAGDEIALRAGIFREQG